MAGTSADAKRLPLPSGSTSLTLSELHQLGGRELRRLCAEQGVDTSHFVEKSDFVWALADAAGLSRTVSAEQFATNHTASGLATPLIFLDVDGVLNGRSTFPAVRLDPQCLGLLVGLARDTGARVVLSTTWRLNTALKMELAEALQAAGAVADLLIGQTPDIGTSRRGEEIESWLSEWYPGGTPPFVVLDDLPIKGVPEGRGVWADAELGLQAADVASARAHLLRTPARPGGWMHLLGQGSHR